jgi:hypothetical protein
MRIAARILAIAASSLALFGFLGCQEDNEKSLLNDSAGKTGVDPKAPSSYEQRQPQPRTTPPSSGGAPVAPAADTGGATNK